MKYFENLFMRGKLLVSFGVVGILFIVVVIIAFINISTIIQSEKKLNDINFQVATQITQLRSHQNHNRAEILNLMMTEDKSEQLTIEKGIEQRSDEMNKIIKNLSLLETDPLIKSQLMELKAIITSYREGRNEEIRLIKEGNIEAAKKLGTGVQSERFEKIRVLAYAMADEAQKNVVDQLVLDTKQATSSKTILILFAFVAFAFTNLVILLLNKIIAKPLDKISKIASSIASGDLSVELKTGNRKDEVGLLNQAFVNMVEKLRSQLGEIGESINVLSSSSSEIMASVTQLASASAETATSVSETTTTVEEVKQTAEVTSYKAKEVSDKAANSAAISLQGETAIENAIEGMYGIQKQMESIANIIVKLSEQSQTISEITSSVNEIAEQSNLLAVNAAIEAAKAGEQGKGFGVVAQEIKNLSERSKEANLQIRNILRDVQKSISTAVMSTEEGNKVVNEGLKLNAVSGESIKALSESVTDSVNASIQIAASSTQQLEGMDQIATAMESIKEASLQASTSTKQSAEAVRDIQQMAENLSRLMKQYKL
jgi:methyl-accepting chemotaxis protein